MTRFNAESRAWEIGSGDEVYLYSQPTGQLLRVRLLAVTDAEIRFRVLRAGGWGYRRGQEMTVPRDFTPIRFGAIASLTTLPSGRQVLPAHLNVLVADEVLTATG